MSHEIYLNVSCDKHSCNGTDTETSNVKLRKGKRERVGDSK